MTTKLVKSDRITEDLITNEVLEALLGLSERGLINLTVQVEVTPEGHRKGEAWRREFEHKLKPQ
jgi:hypothetical protein